MPNDGLLSTGGKAVGFKVSEGGGKRSDWALTGSLAREGPEVLDWIYSYFLMKMSLKLVYRKREISRPNSLERPGGKSKR